MPPLAPLPSRFLSPSASGASPVPMPPHTLCLTCVPCHMPGPCSPQKPLHSQVVHWKITKDEFGLYKAALLGKYGSGKEASMGLGEGWTVLVAPVLLGPCHLLLIASCSPCSLCTLPPLPRRRLRASNALGPAFSSQCLMQR